MLTLPTACYSAYRGYSWSNVPHGLTTERMNAFCRTISASCGDFAESDSVVAGIVVNQDIGAFFTRQNVPNWDAEGRASNYFAFAFFPLAIARMFDFSTMISQDFFWTPSRAPESKIEYNAMSAAEYPADVITPLQMTGRAVLNAPDSIGRILSDFGAKSPAWFCRLTPENALDITCTPWAR